jgi:hypothetical protein
MARHGPRTRKYTAAARTSHRHIRSLLKFNCMAQVQLHANCRRYHKLRVQPAETGLLQPRNLLATCTRASPSLHASLPPLPRPIVWRAGRMLSTFLKGSRTRAARCARYWTNLSHENSPDSIWPRKSLRTQDKPHSFRPPSVEARMKSRTWLKMLNDDRFRQFLSQDTTPSRTNLNRPPDPVRMGDRPSKFD